MKKRTYPSPHRVSWFWWLSAGTVLISFYSSVAHRFWEPSGLLSSNSTSTWTLYFISHCLHSSFSSKTPTCELRWNSDKVSSSGHGSTWLYLHSCLTRSLCLPQHCTVHALWCGCLQCLHPLCLLPWSSGSWEPQAWSGWGLRKNIWSRVGKIGNRAFALWCCWGYGKQRRWAESQKILGLETSF